MPPELDPYILSTMTEAERASILEEQTPQELAAIAAIANGDEDGPDDPADELPADAPATKPDAAKPEAAQANEPAAETPDQPFTPSYQAKLPDDFVDRQAGLKEQAEDLAAKFKSGDLDFDQYRVEADALAKAERALDEVRIKASLSQEMTAQTAEQQWNHTVQRFISATAKDGGIDYGKDPEKQSDLDLFVRSLANDAKNADKPAEWFLSEGHKRVKALHGIGLVTAAPDTKNSRKTPLGAAPKTLAQVPGGDGPGDVDGNEFTDVDNLKGDAQEAAIARMTAAQRERYMLGV
jgi:hypothetical protein